MSLDATIETLRGLIAQRDAITAQIATLLGNKALSVPRKKRVGERDRPKLKRIWPRKRIKGTARGRLDPATTEDIEIRLSSGESVADIVEAVEVSAAYVIKARLNQEGRLA